MKKQLNKSWTALLNTLLLGFGLFTFTASVNASIIKTDIVMLVDESGSMEAVHNNLIDSIGTFAGLLQSGGLDARFALIGFGFAGDKLRLLSPLIELADFSAPLGLLEAWGSTEKIYDATAFALEAHPDETEELDYRDDAVKNLIVFADESSNNDVHFDAADIDGLLKQNSALFNVVLGGNFAELETLAKNNGGNSFDLNLLNSPDAGVVADFVADFAAVKIQETIDFCDENPGHPACSGGQPVPAPAGILLFSLGLLLVSRRQFR
ncbi:vWA domain-containing protein [Alteromonas lipolytica]|nr:vWA domain-containing protein [Alteromonas lipolytica]